jgi:predicted nucleotidyltransferase
MTKEFEKTRKIIERSKRLFYSDVEVNVCTIEDLIIMKLVAGRTKDRLDVETLIPLNRKELNLRYLRARTKEFVAVERSDVPERLEELLAATKSRRKK